MDILNFLKTVRTKYPIKNFLYIFFSVNSEETRLFPSRAADRSGKKKPGFFPGKISETYGQVLIY
ncbi:Uncharacterized protein dnm_049680 [Desulfonema magnum]|uniref:Uncharacterized protein n=1 Tax=Desulfonema magnum TaxID=45655 RepID=A0A975BNS4_9BACT|nr:Uncharacterized protein dnm_049680 [Desulfonema magnum]